MPYVCPQCNFADENETRAVTRCSKCSAVLSRPDSSKNAMTILIEDAAATGNQSAAEVDTIPAVIDGYEVLTQIGVGGMGTVYLAYEPILDRQIALKLLSTKLDKDSSAHATARFLSEAVLTGKLFHAGIVPIYKIGHDAVHGYYYTMRYIKGRTLADIIGDLLRKDPKTTETFTLKRMLNVMVKVCEAIGFAHRNGIVHRDLKPSNIIVADFGEVLVLDWGLAKQFSAGIDELAGMEPEVKSHLESCKKKRETSSQIFLLRNKRSGSRLQQMQAIKPAPQSTPGNITRADQILGTPGYLSPEQAAGLSDTNAASDVFSLGVTLYEILTHRLPVDTGDPMCMITATAMGNFTPIYNRTEAIGLPKALCEIVQRALEVDPTRRFEDAAALATELTLYLEGRATWKPLVKDDFLSTELSADWRVISGHPRVEEKALRLELADCISCSRVSHGDFRCTFKLWADAGSSRWITEINIREVLANGTNELRYQLRIGVDERPFLELINNSRRVQRRLDVRLHAGQVYDIKLELEHDRVRLWVGERKLIDYLEVFPQSGGLIEIQSAAGTLHLQNFSLQSCGAPLQLSFMALPDRLFRTGKFSDARELYRQLAASHPDREEGLLAIYKAGLCSTALKDTQTAFAEFSRLEGTMYDHYCGLGLAQIGMLDGSVEWAWEALKNAYCRHRNDSIKNEVWFSILGLIESLDDSKASRRIELYRELLTDLKPDVDEVSQAAFDLLDLVQRVNGFPGLRQEALRLLKQFSSNPALVNEALFALCRAGIDEGSREMVAGIVDTAMKRRCSEITEARLNILRAEVLMAAGNLEEAWRHLRDATSLVGPATTEAIWARGWQVLIYYLNHDFLRATTLAHETVVRLKNHKVNQLAYFYLLEGVCHLARNKLHNADAAFQKAAGFNCIWGATAANIVSGKGVADLAAQTEKYASNQLVEALFLAGEAYRLIGNERLADQFFSTCLMPQRERAMISYLINNRQLASQINSDKASKTS